jgi:hypothetical protein
MTFGRKAINPSLQRLVSTVQRRSQGTSTMGTVASYPGSTSPERTPTILSGKGFSFSTQVVYSDDTYQHILTNNQDQSNKIEMPLPFGMELNLEQASIAAKNDVFDKILILLSHGDAEHIELNDGTSGDLALTKEGFGKALSASGDTADFCYKRNARASCDLVPELFVTPPLRCAIESLHVAFPHYSPDSIYGTKWLCHGSCIVGERTPIENLKGLFPGLDYTLAQDQSNFLSWLSSRNERVIVVASTPEWVTEFCGDNLEHNDKDLRAVGVKLV